MSPAPDPAPAVLRIATRASQLALWQAHHVADLLRAGDPECVVELVEVSTQGDRDRRAALAQLGGVGVFTREVQHVVREGRADVAVHSLKDLPTTPVAGLRLAGVPRRADRFDLLILPTGDVQPIASLDDLPRGARVGTGSPRRRSQLLHRRPDLEIADVRGNVETRLRKLDAGEYAAIILAQAGLQRLGLDANRRLLRLEPPLMLPAVGQAALGLECRADDVPTRNRLAALTDATTMAEVTAERACLHELQAGCHAPVGTLARVSGEVLTLQTVVLSADGKIRIDGEDAGPVSEAEVIGRRLATQLLERGARPLIDPS